MSATGNLTSVICTFHVAVPKLSHCKLKWFQKLISNVANAEAVAQNNQMAEQQIVKDIAQIQALVNRKLSVKTKIESVECLAETNYLLACRLNCDLHCKGFVERTNFYRRKVQSHRFFRLQQTRKK